MKEFPSSDEGMRHMGLKNLDACRDWALDNGLLRPVFDAQPEPTESGKWMLLMLTLVLALHDPDEWEKIKNHGDHVVKYGHG